MWGEKKVDMLRIWLLGIIVAALVLSVLYGLFPKGSVRAVSKATGGLILMLVILQPLLGNDWTHLEEKYLDYQESIDGQIENYRVENENELAGIIQEKTAAYITDKAAQIGVHCQVQVDTELRSGIPYPSAVILDIPKNKELSDMIQRELEIPADRQQWLGG